MGVAWSGYPSAQLPHHIDNGRVPEDLVAAMAAAAVGQSLGPLQSGIGELPFPPRLADQQPARFEVLIRVLGLHAHQLAETRGVERTDGLLSCR